MPERVDESPAAVYLTERAVPYRLFRHAAAIHSLEQAAEERAQLPQQVVRSILFRLAENSLLMVLMAGPGQVPWKVLRQMAGQSRLTMATEEEVFAATGCRPGTVNPFMRDATVQVWVDQKVIDQPEISLGSGVRGLAILMKPADMLAALPDAKVVQLEG